MTTDPAPNFDTPSTAVEPFGSAPEFVWVPAPPRKFRHRYGLHILLLLLTFFTTTFHDAFEFLWFRPTGIDPFAFFTWPVFTSGLWYSLPLLTILGAHELGHYFACRYYNVDATLPFFIPAPLPITGTFGAVIRIREAFPSRRALFDIGVAGPIAGFVTLLPFLIAGLLMSDVQPIPEGTLSFGDPLLFKLLSRFHFGTIPTGWDVVLHPMGFAAWWGMLATALNLLPFGQLDGGHLMYAVFGRRATRVSILTLALVGVLTIQSSSWLAMAMLMVAMAIFFGIRHPRPLDEQQPLGRTRLIVAGLAVVIFALCFTPIPVDISGANAPAPAKRNNKIEVRHDTARPPTLLASAGLR